MTVSPSNPPVRPSTRLWWWVRLVLATGLVVEGLRLPFTTSRNVLAVALACISLGAVWLLRILLAPRSGETETPLLRKKVALAIASTVVGLVTALAIAAQIPAPSDAHAIRWIEGLPMGDQSADLELGWAPFAPPDVVGQRLERVDASRERILFVGDSIVYGMGVSDDETMTHLIETRAPGVQVLNAAVSGYSLDQDAIYLARILPEVRPSLVVVGVFTGNDFQVTGREFSWGHSKPLFDVTDGSLVRIDHAGACIDGLAGSFLFRPLWHDPETAVDTIETFCHPRWLPRGSLERTITALADDMADRSREHDAPILFVLLPVQFEYSYEPVRFPLVSRHLDLRRLIEAGGHDVFDVSDDLGHHGDTAELFQDDHAHFTARGHAFLADVLEREIRARGHLGGATPAVTP